MNKNELAIWQGTRVENDKTFLITKLLHSSGEELVSEMLIPFTDDPQKFGSYLTYFKRYQITCILGISADEDDDGNQVSQNSMKVNLEQKPVQQQVVQQSQQASKPSEKQIFAVKKISSQKNIQIDVDKMSSKDAFDFIKLHSSK